MRCVVTGAAGFIGSHLCEHLLESGHDVAGIDAFIPYYPRRIKEANLAACLSHPGFGFHELDLRTDVLEPILEGTDVIFHLAAMAGLRRSWTDFELYQSCNVVATQRLLQAAVRLPALRRFVYASTSSVYGRFSAGDESLSPRPISPYGVTKLAGEELCRAYAEECGLPLNVLRYFSVYGPRQRPDMGYYRFVQALLAGESVVVYGDGQQVRGNTYVSDCVRATVAVLQAPLGETYNVGGGEPADVWDVLETLEQILCCQASVSREPARQGDQRYTCADARKLHRHVGWEPRVPLAEGLASQVAWQKEQHQERYTPSLVGR